MKKQNKKQSVAVSRKNRAITLFAIVVIASLAVLGLSLYVTANQQNVSNLKSQRALVTVTGTISCLPHKDEQAIHTEVCLYGLKVNNAYYGLANVKNGETLADGRTVTVTGELKPPVASETYDVVGVITVSSLTHSK